MSNQCKTFREYWDDIPSDEQNKILALLKTTLMWRGWVRLDHVRSVSDLLDQIAEVFSENGCDIDEYT